MHRPNSIVAQPSRSPRLIRPAAALSAVLLLPLALGACSSSDDDAGPSDDAGGLGAGGGAGVGAGGGAGDGAGDAPGNTVPVIEGDIARYGVVNVTDDAGQAGDAVATFNRVEPGVGALAFGTAVDPGGEPCEVVPSSSNGNDLLLMGYAPSARGARNTSIMAGETITLSSAQGTWTTLTASTAGAVTFYVGPVPDGAVPVGLQVDVSAAADAAGFPGVAMATLPTVVPLSDFAQSPTGAISADTTFSWQASDDAASRVRIVASTGFFGDTDNGKRVSCLVPDSGTFAFPADVRGELGAEFQGELFLASRLSIGTRQDGDTLLFLIRESFTPE